MDIRKPLLLIMTLLLAVGAFKNDFDLKLEQVALTFIFGLCTQYLWIYYLKIQKKIGFLSALITCFGIAFLLRTNSLYLHPLVAVISVSSKFIFRIDKLHIFNPSAFGIAIAFLFFYDEVWISPGQWGSHISTAIWFIAFGFLIISKIKRLDTAWLFLMFFLGFHLIRNLYLGYEWSILLNTALNGSLLLFAFFMISDPKTSPQHFKGRVVHVFLVAVTSFVLCCYMYETNSFIYSLLFANLFVPLWNRIFKAVPFEWENLMQKKILDKVKIS